VIGDEEHRDIVSNIPISIYTQRMVEGAFGITPAQSTNPFARNSAFTNEVHDPIKLHSEADDGGKVFAYTGANAHMAGRELQELLLNDIQTFLSEAKHPAIVLDAVSTHVGGDTTSELNVGRVLRALKVPMPNRKISAVAHMLAGMQAQDFASLLLAPPRSLSASSSSSGANSNGAASQTASSGDDAFMYRATILAHKAREAEDVTFKVPKSVSMQRLQFPADVPVVKAILRKRGITATRVLSLQNET